MYNNWFLSQVECKLVHFSCHTKVFLESLFMNSAFEGNLKICWSVTISSICVGKIHPQLGDKEHISLAYWTIFCMPHALLADEAQGNNTSKFRINLHKVEGLHTSLMPQGHSIQIVVLLSHINCKCIASDFTLTSSEI